MLNGNQAVAFEWSFAGLALIFVLLRLYVRIFHGPSSRLNWSDWIVVIAWLNFAACCACDVELNRLGFIHPSSSYHGNLSMITPDPEKTVRILKIIYYSIFPYIIDLWLIKAGILSFYYVVIPRTLPLYRWFLHITAGLCIVTFFMVFFINMFWCDPIWRNWSLDEAEICVASAKEPPFFLTVGSTIITDLLIFFLPFPLLQNIHLPRRKMVGVIVLFTLGSLTILAAICRVAVIARTANVTEVTAWTAVECSTGIIVACAPALRVLLIRRERNPSGGLSKSTRSYPRPGPPIFSASDRNEIWDGTDATAPHWIRMASIPGSAAVSPREPQFDDAVIEALSKQLTPGRNSHDFRNSSFSNFDMVAQIPNMRLQLGRGIIEHAPMSPRSTRSPVDDHMTIGSISPRTISPLTSPDFIRLDHRPGSDDVSLNRWDTNESGRLELGRIVENAAGVNRPRSISRNTCGNGSKSGPRGFL